MRQPRRADDMFTVIIPANNEAEFIETCLDAVIAQTIRAEDAGGLAVIVAANACTDRTVAIAEAMKARAGAAGWRLTVLDLPEGGKPGALNAADDAAGSMEEGDIRLYLDADVVAEAPLFDQLRLALAPAAPLYASGKLTVAPAKSWVTRAYADLWRRLPFMTRGVPGAGLFAVNAAGRARWGAFPAIISDDTYVRLSFAPEERVGAPAAFHWPMVEGFGALRRVRRRQDEGVKEVARLYPERLVNNDPGGPGARDAIRLFLTAPFSFCVYAAVSVAVRFGGSGGWTRGR